MRTAAALALAFSLLSPSFAGAAAADEGAAATRQKRGRSCTAISRQVAHYEELGRRARQRDEPVWERANAEHLDRLRAYQKRQCPQDVPSVADQLAAGLRTLGDLALTAFTLGAF